MKSLLTSRRFLGGLSLSLVGIALLIEFSGNTPIQLLTDEETLSKEEPDAFVSGATYSTFNDKGELQSQLVAERAEHYPEGDVGQLQSPRLTLVDENGATWEMQAQTGRFDLKGSKLLLSGFVTVTGQDQDGTPLRLDSPELSYDEATGFIKTDQPVTIYSRFNQLSATGMTFNLDARTLVLHSRVEGLYVQ